MLSDELKRRGQAFIEELDLARDQSTEKWMAHYLAELMKRAENTTDEMERSQTSKQCAELITALWEQRQRATRRQLYSAINSDFYEVYNHRSSESIMREMVADPLQNFSEDNDIAIITMMFVLNEYETDLLRMFILANAIVQLSSDDITHEITVKIVRFEEAFVSTRKFIQDIWPEVDNIMSENILELSSFVKRCISDIQKIRTHICNGLINGNGV